MRLRSPILLAIIGIINVFIPSVVKLTIITTCTMTITGTSSPGTCHAALHHVDDAPTDALLADVPPDLFDRIHQSASAAAGNADDRGGDAGYLSQGRGGHVRQGGGVGPAVHRGGCRGEQSEGRGDGGRFVLFFVFVVCGAFAVIVLVIIIVLACMISHIVAHSWIHAALTSRYLGIGGLKRRRRWWHRLARIVAFVSTSAMVIVIIIVCVIYQAAHDRRRGEAAQHRRRGEESASTATSPASTVITDAAI